LGEALTEPSGEEKAAAPVEELPEWMKSDESLSAPVETSKVGDDLPDWLRHPILSEELESAVEPEIPTWVDENMPVPGQAAPTMPEEWVPAEANPEAGLGVGSIPEITPVDENLPTGAPEPASEVLLVSEPKPDSQPKPALETIPVTEPETAVESLPVTEPAPEAVQTIVHPPTLKETGILSTVPADDKDAELLFGAQMVLDKNSLDDSMKQYSKLIKKGHLLDEVIHDLQEAIHHFPVEVNIWKTLGDAYMRANRLQDALDAYTKAEELLR
jgi:hypothetical protein